MKILCILKHNWSKWSALTDTSLCWEKVQFKRCERCGKIKRRYVTLYKGGQAATASADRANELLHDVELEFSQAERISELLIELQKKHMVDDLEDKDESYTPLEEIKFKDGDTHKYQPTNGHVFQAPKGLHQASKEDYEEFKRFLSSR